MTVVYKRTVKCGDVPASSVYLLPTFTILLLQVPYLTGDIFKFGKCCREKLKFRNKKFMDA